MKNNLRLVALLTVAAVVFLSVSGCEYLLTTEEIYPEYSISGEVIDARTADTKVATVEVSLVDDSGSSVAQQQSGTDGSFTFEGVEPGVYTLQASRSGDWAFIEKRVDLVAEAVTGVEILGFESDDAVTISFFVVWEDGTDVDAYLSYPDRYLGGITPPVLANPYQMSAVNGYAPTYDAGSGSELVSSNRETVGWSGVGGDADGEASTTTLNDVYADGDTRPVAEREREVTSGPGVETISLRGMPFEFYSQNYSYATTGAGDTGLDSGSYAWLGVAEYYVDSFTGSLATEGEASSVNAVVYVTQGSTVKGEYRISDFTDLETVSVVRVNLFERDNGSGTNPQYTEVYQIVPDQRVVDPGFGVNSVGSTDDGIVVLSGASR